MEALGGEFSYTKYWIEGKYYTPVRGFEKYIDTFGAITEDNPVIFAARVRAGFSSGEIPGRNSISSVDPTRSELQDDEFEGSEMFLANLELRIPMEKAFSLAVFYRTGNAWKDDKSFSFSDLQDAWGVGVRVRRLWETFASTLPRERMRRTHFGFGELF
jgi:outer membrane protein insertion porin family